MMASDNVERPPVARYSGVTQAIHWATATLVLIAFILGPGGSEQRVYSPGRDFDRQLHETLGFCVFALVALRVVWLMLDARPNPQGPRWMKIAATVTHAALYVLLFAIPLTAISGAWLEGHPVTLLAGVEIPPALPLAHDLGATIALIHTWLGDTIMWVAGLHALAALCHQFIIRDNVLASMLPWLPLRNPNGD